MSSAVTRRLVTIPVVVVALPILIVSTPLWLMVAVIADLVSRLHRFPSVRLGLMAVVYLAHEWACLAAALYLAARGAVAGASRPQAERLAPYRRVEGWWASSLLRWSRRLLGVRFDLPDLSDLPADGFIMLSRHASMADALLPVYLIAGRLDRFIHYVIKRELRFDPTIDIYGRRLANYFITRTGDGETEAAAIGGLAHQALPRSALVIYPEGTYASPGRRARVRRSLAARGEPELVALADDLHHLLPPKPAGTLALLAGQPTFDVVILGHVGLEGVSNLSGLRRRLPLEAPVVVRWWHHPRSSLPVGDEPMIAWLNQQWRSLDRWVGSLVGVAPTGPKPTGDTP